MLSAAVEAPPSVPRFRSTFSSPLEGVPLPAWRRLVDALDMHPMDAVSERGGFGSYDLRPRRLFELGYVADLRRVSGKGRRQLYTCRFLPPWTEKRFLSDPVAQLKALEQSMRGYQEDLRAGRIQQPEGASLCETLTVLHCGGRGALSKWPQQLFDHTRAVLARAQGAF